MKTPFYINADVLEKPWGSKHDILIVVFFIIGLIATSLAYIGITHETFSTFAKIGIGGAYIGLLIGVILHLGQQIRKGDEFATNIITTAIAQAGLSTILFVAVVTVINAILGTDNLATWNLIAPVYFLFTAFFSARVTARKYANLTV